MDIAEAISSSKSIGGYKPAPVPKEIPQEILEIATRSDVATLQRIKLPRAID